MISKMAKPGSEVLKQVNDCVAQLVSFLSSSGIEHERCRNIVETLHKRWLVDENAILRHDELAHQIGLNVEKEDDRISSTNAVRNAVKKLRQKLLPQFYREKAATTIRVHIDRARGKGGYQLRIGDEFAAHHGDREHLIHGREHVVLIANARANNQSWFRETIRKSRNVLFVTIGSQHTLDLILPWFENGSIEAEHFRVLVWRPRSLDIVKVLTDHLEENPRRFFKKQQLAWRSWKSIEQKHPFVEVYGYESIPTMQATCDGDRSICVELLPFNRANLKQHFHACGGVDDRPALFATATNNPQSFWLFKNSFEDLWFDSMQRASPSEVHKDRRESRINILRERGLAQHT